MVVPSDNFGGVLDFFGVQVCGFRWSKCRVFGTHCCSARQASIMIHLSYLRCSKAAECCVYCVDLFVSFGSVLAGTAPEFYYSCQRALGPGPSLAGNFRTVPTDHSQGQQCWGRGVHIFESENSKQHRPHYSML